MEWVANFYLTLQSVSVSQFVIFIMMTITGAETCLRKPNMIDADTWICITEIYHELVRNFAHVLDIA